MFSTLSGCVFYVIRMCFLRYQDVFSTLSGCVFYVIRMGKRAFEVIRVQSDKGEGLFAVFIS